MTSDLRGEYDKLGTHQASLFRALNHHGFWSPGGGWHYGTPNRTVRLLETLEKRGLVKCVGNRWTVTVHGQAVIKDA